MNLDQHFNIIHDKLQQMLKQMNRLHKENDKLKNELDMVKNKETIARQKVEELQQQTSILKLAAVEMDNKDKKDFEKKINQYIKEVDKCISFLSQ
jgi:predicted nuclease with TOPRIM domain